MAQPSLSDLRAKLPSTPVLAATGAFVFCVALTTWIFAPGGFLDSLTRPDADLAEPDLLMPTETEASVPTELSQEKNVEFLAANAKKEGVKTTDSGLQYRQLQAGAGKQPGPRSRVTVHYTGKLINGKEFDSSVGGDPITFGLNQVIPGWTEGLQLMREGEKAELVIPEDIGYGARGAPGAIPPYQTLVFQVELIKVQ